eukprot:GHVS01031641.1.p1 GENE.GHVS01031641.1~~GHVS01031641.1.p1  ORF type:complete len:123 (+),score=15.01 GHVS01031641.1:150-518(+)
MAPPFIMTSSSSLSRMSFSSSLPSSLQKLPKLLFLGAPGAGKGTYASSLCRSWNIPHVSTGDIIREEVKAKTKLGDEFKSYSESGALVPDRLVIEIAKYIMGRNEKKKWILFYLFYGKKRKS